MPAELSASERDRPLRVATSPVLDLTFALFALTHESKLENRRHDWAQRLFNEEPALGQRLLAFWPQAGEEWLELPVYAFIAGTLFAPTAGETLDRIQEVAASEFPLPEMPTEDPHVLDLVRDRVDELRRDPGRRADYAALLRETWAFLEPYWAAAAPGATARAAQLERRMAIARDPYDAIPRTHIARREEFAATTQGALAAGEVVIVPMALTEEGHFFFGLPGLLLVGFGPFPSRRVQARREAATESAARFKVLADPTRLALLSRLMHGSHSIGDLAAYYDLSQPTVSVHMKMLREAGLLEWDKRGASTFYRASADRVRQYTEEALAQVTEH